MNAFEKLSQQYLAACKRTGFSSWSIRSYQKALDNFFAWIAEQYPGANEITAINREMIAEYQMHLYKRASRFKKRLSLQTQYNWTGIVLWFFRWLM